MGNTMYYAIFSLYLKIFATISWLLKGNTWRCTYSPKLLFLFSFLEFYTKLKLATLKTVVLIFFIFTNKFLRFIKFCSMQSVCPACSENFSPLRKASWFWSWAVYKTITRDYKEMVLLCSLYICFSQWRSEKGILRMKPKNVEERCCFRNEYFMLKFLKMLKKICHNRACRIIDYWLEKSKIWGNFKTLIVFPNTRIFLNDS